MTRAEQSRYLQGILMASLENQERESLLESGRFTEQIETRFHTNEATLSNPYIHIRYDRYGYSSNCNSMIILSVKDDTKELKTSLELDGTYTVGDVETLAKLVRIWATLEDQEDGDEEVSDSI